LRNLKEEKRNKRGKIFRDKSVDRKIEEALAGQKVRGVREIFTKVNIKLPSEERE